MPPDQGFVGDEAARVTDFAGSNAWGTPKGVTQQAGEQNRVGFRN